MEAPNKAKGFLTLMVIAAVAVWLIVPLIGKFLPSNTITV